MNRPLLAQAAAAGDSRAMALSTVRGQRREIAETQLAQAARQEDPDAMFALGLLGLRDRTPVLWMLELDQSGSGTAHQSGVLPEDLAAIASSAQWLQAAAHRGVAPAMARLAQLPTLPEPERLQWLRAAATAGAWRAASHYADRLSGTDQKEEAVRWYELDVEAGSAYAATRLAKLYGEKGDHKRASDLQRLAAELDRPPFTGVAMADVEPIVITALATTAVVPFLQTLVTKTAEDAYPHIRALIARLFNRSSPAGPYDSSPHRLLLVQDDVKAMELFLWADLSDDAIRALGELNLAELMALPANDEGVRLAWDARRGNWIVSFYASTLNADGGS
jgi:hypothetical protein